MTEAEQKIQFKSSNPYLDPIMEAFNSNKKGEEIIANNFKKYTIQLVKDAEQGKFYKEISEFIKDAKKVANKKSPTDKDIEGLQNKKKEIVGMVKSNYDELLKTILEAIDDNKLEAQAEKIKQTIHKNESLNKIDKYNLTTLIDETVKLEKVSNELSIEEEYNKKVEEEIKQNKNDILNLVGDGNKEFKNKLHDFISQNQSNTDLITKVKEELSGIITDDDLRESIIKKVNTINKLKTTSFTQEQGQQKKNKEQQKTKITQAINNCEKQRTQLELALDTPIACCFNINTNTFDKVKQNFNKGLCPTTNKPQVEETLQQIQDFCDIVKQVINTDGFKKYINQNKNEAYKVIETNLKNTLLNGTGLITNSLDQKIGTIIFTFKSLLYSISNVEYENKQTHINKLIEITTKFTELLKTACDIKNTNKEDKIKEICNKIDEIRKELIKLSMNDINEIIKELQKLNTDNINKIINKLEELSKINIEPKTKNKLEKLQASDTGAIIKELETLNTENTALINQRIAKQFTEIGTLIASIISSNMTVTAEQQEQLIWNQIYVDRANPNVAQQQDCIKTIQYINKDNPKTTNEELIKEVINSKKNYEGLTKIHGTNHNDAKNEVDIKNDTITISEKNKIGGNVKDDKRITISDYVINEFNLKNKKKCKLSNDGSAADQKGQRRNSNELFALLSKISDLKELQKEAYTDVTKQIAEFIQKNVLEENNFPNTSGGVVISALKNLYDTNLNIKDSEEKAVGETFGDVMVQLKVLMGDKYKSGFEDKVDRLIKSSKEKVEKREKEEREKQELEKKQQQANAEIQELNNEYKKTTGSFTVDTGTLFEEQVTRIEENIKTIEKLKEKVEKCKEKFAEGGEFTDVNKVKINNTTNTTVEEETLSKEGLTSKFEGYNKELDEVLKRQKEELKKVIQKQREELLKTAKNLKDKATEEDNDEIEKLENDIDTYNGLVEKYNNNILNLNATEDGNKIEPIDSSTDEDYKDLLIAIETAKYEKKKVEEQQKQQEEEDKKLEEEKKKKEIEEQVQNHAKNREKQKLIEEAEEDKKEIEKKGTGYTALKDKFSKIDEIKAETLDKKQGEESEKTNEQIIQENIKLGEKLLEKLNKFKNDNRKYKDILNENSVKLDENIDTEGFENALKEYKNKYKEEKEKQIKELITGQDIDKTYDIFKNFEEYCKEKIDFTETVTDLKKAIKDKKKGLIIQKIPELLTYEVDKQTEKSRNKSPELKKLIDGFKEDFKGVDGIDNDIKEINDKIKEHIDNLLKTDENTQVVKEEKLQEAHDIFSELKDIFTKDEQKEFEEKEKEVKEAIFNKKVEKAVEDNKQKEKEIKIELENKIKSIKEKIEKIDITDEESKKDAEEKLTELEKEVNEFNNGKEEDKQIKKVKITTSNEKGEQEEKVEINDLRVKFNKKLFAEEKNRIEGENKKINTPNGDYTTHYNNIVKIREGAPEGKKVESLTGKQQEQLDEADECLHNLIQLRKDADKHDEKTTDETYEKERLNGYNDSGTTNIQINLTNKINNIKDGIFKTHRELLNNRINTITEKHNSSKKDLENVDISKIADDNLKDDVLKINTAFDLLNDFDTLIKDIEKVDKLIEEYNNLDKSKQEKKLNKQKEEVKKLKQDLEDSLNSKLDEIDNIITTNKVKKTNDNNDNKKPENKKQQQPVGYKKLKNACLAVVQILEHKEACKVLTLKEQKRYVDVCMQLGWLNTLKEKESGFKGNSIESFIYYNKALKVLENEKYNDKNKLTDKKNIVEVLVEQRVLQNAEKELTKQAKKIKKDKVNTESGTQEKDLGTQIKRLETNIKNIKKNKDPIDKKVESILELEIVNIADNIKEKGGQNPNPQKPSSTQSAPQLSNQTSQINSNVPPVSPLNFSNSGKPTISLHGSTNSSKSSTPQHSNQTSQINSNVSPTSPISPTSLSISAQSQQPTSSTPKGISETQGGASSIPVEEEVVVPTSSTSQTVKSSSSSMEQKEDMSVSQNYESKQNDRIDLLKQEPKPAAGEIPNAKQNKQSESNINQESKHNQKQNQTSTEANIPTQNPPQSNEKKSSSMLMFMMMFMVMSNIMEQKKKTQELFMKSMFSSNPFGSFGKGSMMPNNYYNNPFINNPLSLFNMLNNLNSSLNDFNMFNRFNNQRLF